MPQVVNYLPRIQGQVQDLVLSKAHMVIEQRPNQTDS
jgi:hypothetical protein